MGELPLTSLGRLKSLDRMASQPTPLQLLEMLVSLRKARG